MPTPDRVKEYSEFWAEEFVASGNGRRRHGRWRHGRPRLLWKIVLIVVALLLVAAGLGALRARATYESASRHILRGIRVGGVDVGGLTRAEAVQAVSSAVKEALSRPITIHAAGQSWQSTPWDLGVRADVEQAVGQAVAIADSLSFYQRVVHRLRNEPVYRSIPLSYVYPTEGASALVKRIDRAVYGAPTDATMKLVADHIAMRKSHPGRTLASGAALQGVMAALRAGSADVVLGMKAVAPRVTESTLGKTITVDLSTNTLRLYDGFHVLRTYPVATARQGFATPVGTWKVVAKVVNPSWANPDPTGWGKGEPLFIPPGPNNPLGLRAMYLDAPGIRIHGTPDSASIGTYASHGCIRMLEQDVIALYPLVPQDTTVLIYGAPPWGLGGPVGVPGT